MPTNPDLAQRVERAEGASVMMPAISLWQPWASFIAIGVKPYETRHWSPPFRMIGRRIAIHAAKRKPDADDTPWWHKVSGATSALPLGAIVCTAILDADIPANQVPWDEFGDYGPGRRAWKLTHIEIVEPAIPVKGAQGFWWWDSSALRARATENGNG